MATLKQVYSEAPNWAKKAVKKALKERRGITDQGFYHLMNGKGKFTVEDFRTIYDSSCIGFHHETGFFFDYEAAKERDVTEDAQTAEVFGMKL
ncbi:hypothetical protein [Salmonirosea aquatica]|uniref:Uncharacterized protein n=1 Tax=Salmonirosea aquatica TaxID=2654236 RepID=A0A7C9BLW1_9BACT|nr:hypothetical protein [Cytophagaceae bacterium SJW1-29]MPR37134.1 hypothetical protein [Cytophagaceae bacterium SJW1-29]